MSKRSRADSNSQKDISVGENREDADEKIQEIQESKESVSSSTGPLQKRTNAISWDDYFMSVAFLSSMRSKDPNTQVGACIVNDQQRIVGIGYNGALMGCFFYYFDLINLAMRNKKISV